MVQSIVWIAVQTKTPKIVESTAILFKVLFVSSPIPVALPADYLNRFIRNTELNPKVDSSEFYELYVNIRLYLSIFSLPSLRLIGLTIRAGLLKKPRNTGLLINLQKTQWRFQGERFRLLILRLTNYINSFRFSYRF